MVDAITEDDWRDWIEAHGRHGVLAIDSPHLCPPGLRDALEFGQFDLFLPEHALPSTAVDQGGYLEVRINAGLIAEESVEAGIIQRVIRTGQTARHVLFSVPRLYWNRGNARAMLSHAVGLYDSLEIEQITLEADGLGKYIWAAAGFDFADEQIREATNTALRLFAQDLGIFDGELPDFQHPWEVLALDLDENGNRQYVEADRLETVLAERGEIRLIEGFRPGRMAVSKALYLYSRYDSWEGILDLRPESSSRQQLDLYLGR